MEKCPFGITGSVVVVGGIIGKKLESGPRNNWSQHKGHFVGFAKQLQITGLQPSTASPMHEFLSRL